MEFGIDKCAILTVAKGIPTQESSLEIPNMGSINVLGQNEQYKYLGIKQHLGINHKNIKTEFRRNYCNRIKIIMKTYLSGLNKIRAMNTWALPALGYSFGILKWNQTELDAIDRWLRVTMTKFRMHHPRSSIMRLYLPRKNGGRGLLNIKNMHNHEINELRKYFLSHHKDGYDEIVTHDQRYTPLNLSNSDIVLPVLKIEDRIKVWKEKELHGRFFHVLCANTTDTKSTVHWLQHGDLYSETEGFIFAIQDQVIATRNYHRFIMKDNTVDRCRACGVAGETLRHITSGCSSLATTEYLYRHNVVAKIIHQQLALDRELLSGPPKPYFKYNPETILENDRFKMTWDHPVLTDRMVGANRPDIVLVDKLNKKAFFIDITIPYDENICKAEQDKIQKYFDLSYEYAQIWHIERPAIIPIVISTNGVIPKTLKTHLITLNLNVWLEGYIQKAVILANARIVRKFLSM